jgi:hypothetical protein
LKLSFNQLGAKFEATGNEGEYELDLADVGEEANTATLASISSAGLTNSRGWLEPPGDLVSVYF